MFVNIGKDLKVHEKTTLENDLLALLWEEF